MVWTWAARAGARRRDRQQRASWVRLAIVSGVVLWRSRASIEWDWTEGAVNNAISTTWGWGLDVIYTWVIAPIVRAVTFIGGTVASWVMDRLGEVYNLIGDIPQVVGSVWDFIIATRDAIWSAIQDIKGELGDVANWVFDQVHDAASYFWQVTRDLIVTVIKDGLAAAGWLWDLIYDNIVGPALGVLDNIWDRIYQLVSETVAAAWNGFWDAADWVWARVQNIAHAVVEAAMMGLGDILNLVSLCWDFLTFVATHPFSWWAELIDHALEGGGGWLLDHLTRAMAENEPRLDDFLGQLFG